MPEAPIRLQLPITHAALLELRAGDAVLLSGPVYTARDVTHEQIVAELRALGSLPYGLAGQTLFYAGPTPAAAGRVIGAVGPTTAARMDAWTPELLAAGVVATIGKGARAAEVRDACAATDSVYFAAVGGAAALLATTVTAAEAVAYDELGTEALVRLELSDFPAFVAIDTEGTDLYGQAPKEWREGGGQS